MSESLSTASSEMERLAERCVICKQWTFDSPVAGGCGECRRRYPAALIKAQCDSFDYALRLNTGEMVLFSEATITGEWVHLEHLNRLDHDSPPFALKGYRGVDVRVDAIVWCADAPFDS